MTPSLHLKENQSRPRCCNIPGPRTGDGLSTKCNDISVVYKLPCDDCETMHIGETLRGFSKVVYEHKNDLSHYRTSNSMALQAEKHVHLPKWNDTQVLLAGFDKKRAKDN